MHDIIPLQGQISPYPKALPIILKRQKEQPRDKEEIKTLCREINSLHKVFLCARDLENRGFERESNPRRKQELGKEKA